MKFFRYVFASALGTFLAGGVLLVMMFAFLFASIGALMDDFASEQTARIDSNSILHLSLNGPIVERASNDDMVIPGFSEEQTGSDSRSLRISIRLRRTIRSKGSI